MRDSIKKFFASFFQKRTAPPIVLPDAERAWPSDCPVMAQL